MSRAFIRENDGQSLDEIGPGMNSLVAYLTQDNNGIRVYEKKNYFSERLNKEIHEMSNGLAYALNDESKWYVVRNL